MIGLDESLRGLRLLLIPIAAVAAFFPMYIGLNEVMPNHWSMSIAALLMFSVIPLALLYCWPEFDRSPPTVTFDATGIVCNWDSGSFAKNISWIELDEVLIVTKSKGPFEEEVFIVLQRDAEHGLAIPKDARGTQELLAELHRRLPRFDRETVILAMGTTTAGEFRIWQRPRRGSTVV